MKFAEYKACLDAVETNQVVGLFIDLFNLILLFFGWCSHYTKPCRWPGLGPPEVEYSFRFQSLPPSPFRPCFLGKCGLGWANVWCSELVLELILLATESVT